MPRLLVIRFAKSIEAVEFPMSSSSRNQDNVGKLHSSATNGSSVIKVAGNELAPAKPCANAAPLNKIMAAASGDTPILRNVMNSPKKKRASREAPARQINAARMAGGPRVMNDA